MLVGMGQCFLEGSIQSGFAVGVRERPCWARDLNIRQHALSNRIENLPSLFNAWCRMYLGIKSGAYVAI